MKFLPMTQILLIALRKRRGLSISLFLLEALQSRRFKNAKSSKRRKKEEKKNPRIAKLAESEEKAIEVHSSSKELLKDSTDKNRELLEKSLADRSLKQLKNLRSVYVSNVHNQYLQLKKNASFSFERNENIFNVAHFGLLKNKRIENDVVAKCGSFKATRKQVRSLDNQKWVSSAVVDVFTEYINCEELNSTNHRRLVCFESAFGSHLMKFVSENEINEEGVQKYAKIFERDFYEEELPKTLMMFYIPHCIDNHWALHIIDLENKRVIMSDSYPVARHRIQKQISEKIAQLFTRLMSKYRNRIDKLEVVDGTEVFQDNGYDCGVLMLKYLLEWKHNAKPIFTNREAFLYRIDLVDKLLRNKHNIFHSEICHGVLELTSCLDVEELRKNMRE